MKRASSTRPATRWSFAATCHPFGRVLGGRIDPAIVDDGLDRFAALAEREGFVPIVLYTPSAQTAHAATARFDDPAIADLLAQFSRTLRAHLAEWACRNGVHYVDLTPTLSEAAVEVSAADRLYFATNVHFTPGGHAVVAGRVAELLGALDADPEASPSASGADACVQIPPRSEGTAMR